MALAPPGAALEGTAPYAGLKRVSRPSMVRLKPPMPIRRASVIKDWPAAGRTTLPSNAQHTSASVLRTCVPSQGPKTATNMQQHGGFSYITR